jgi:hypothetical protein
MRACISVILAAVVSLVAVDADAQSHSAKRPTLVDLAREHGSVERHSMGCGWLDGPPTLERLVTNADVIVHGTVVAVSGKLSADQHEVLTDYTVQPITIVLDRTGDRRVIGSSQPPVFTARGGTVLIDGLRIHEQATHNGSGVSLELGDEVVLFGKSRNGSFELEPFGVFRVQAGRVSPNGQWPQLSSSGDAVSLATFLSMVASR